MTMRAYRSRCAIAGKPCSATAEKHAQSRLKRGSFTTIEGLFYGNPEANFAAAPMLAEWLAMAFYTGPDSAIAAIAYQGVRLSLIVMPFSFTSRSDHHVSTASIARCGMGLRVAREKTGRSSLISMSVDDKPDE